MSDPHVRIGGTPAFVGPSIVRVRSSVAHSTIGLLSAGRVVRVRGGGYENYGCGWGTSNTWDADPHVVSWDEAPAETMALSGAAEWNDPYGPAGFIFTMPDTHEMGIHWRAWMGIGTEPIPVTDDTGETLWPGCSASLLVNGVAVDTITYTTPDPFGSGYPLAWPQDRLYQLTQIPLDPGDVVTVELEGAPPYLAGWEGASRLWVGGACFAMGFNET